LRGKGGKATYADMAKLAGKASLIKLLCRTDGQMMMASDWYRLHAVLFLLHQTLAAIA